ncbi:MAG: hypothetical protein ROW39_12280, partial [Anaerolineaceae bacterium]
LVGAIVNVMIYIPMGMLLLQPLGVLGISLTDSVAFTIQTIFLLVMLLRKPFIQINVISTVVRVIPGALAALGVVLAVQAAGIQAPAIFIGLAGMVAGGLMALPFIWQEIRVLLRL